MIEHRWKIYFESLNFVYNCIKLPISFLFYRLLTQQQEIREINCSYTQENTTRKLVQAFISCRLDYCNSLTVTESLFYGMTDTLFQRLQSIQNAAARLATGTRLSEHIQPALRRLHWLPVRKRVDFKLATLVFQALHGLGLLPSYLSDDCQLITDTGRSQLRSSTNNTCFVPRSHNNFGDRSFSVAGPALWNSLPASLRSPEHGYSTFKRLLKTYLFWYETSAHLWQFVKFANCINFLTYLLTYIQKVHLK